MLLHSCQIQKGSKVFLQIGVSVLTIQKTLSMPGLHMNQWSKECLRVGPQRNVLVRQPYFLTWLVWWTLWRSARHLFFSLVLRSATPMMVVLDRGNCVVSLNCRSGDRYPRKTLNRNRPVAAEVMELWAYSTQESCGLQRDWLADIKSSLLSWLALSVWPLVWQWNPHYRLAWPSAPYRLLPDPRCYWFPLSDRMSSGMVL